MMVTTCWASTLRSASAAAGQALCLSTACWGSDTGYKLFLNHLELLEDILSKGPGRSLNMPVAGYLSHMAHCGSLQVIFVSIAE